MTAMLRHTPTGNVFPMNAELAKRDDMVMFTPDADSKPTPTKKSGRGKAKAEEVKAPEPVTEGANTTPEADDSNLDDLLGNLPEDD